MAAYWFATSMKWFTMFLLLGLVVKEIVPGGEEGTLWGRVVFIGACWAAIGPAIFGFLSDRTRTKYGRWRPYVAVGSGLTVIALIVLAQADKYWVIVVGYFVLQVADDLATGPYSQLVPGLVPKEQRGRASGIIGMVEFAAQLVAVGIALIAHILGDIQMSFLVIAGVNVTCAAITILTVREDPIVNAVERVPIWKAFLSPWKSKDFTWAWATRFLNALGFYLVLTYLALFLASTFTDFSVFGFQIAKVDDDTTATQAATRSVLVLALLIAVCGAIGSVIGGRAADKIGRKRVIYLAGTTMGGLLIPFALVHSFTLTFCLAIFFGIAYGAFVSANWALVSDVLPSQDDLAKDMGIWQSSIAMPQIVVGLLGMVVDWGNRAFEPGGGYTIIFLLASVFYFISTILVRMIRRTM